MSMPRGGGREKSGQVAKNRLKLVLFQDRLNLSPDMLEMLKSDVFEAISKYVVIDKEAFDLQICPIDAEDKSEGQATLVANMPIVDVKRSR